MINLYKNLPILDLHGETSDISKVLIKEFINDNYLLNKKQVIIIHGKGLGILKKIVINELKINKYVKDYKIDFFNDGQTIVTLQSNNK